jgi:hypothetical protein
MTLVAPGNADAHCLNEVGGDDGGALSRMRLMSCRGVVAWGYPPFNRLPKR